MLILSHPIEKRSDSLSGDSALSSKLAHALHNIKTMWLTKSLITLTHYNTAAQQETSNVKKVTPTYRAMLKKCY